MFNFEQAQPSSPLHKCLQLHRLPRCSAVPLLVSRVSFKNETSMTRKEPRIDSAKDTSKVGTAGAREKKPFKFEWVKTNINRTNNETL